MAVDGRAMGRPDLICDPRFTTAADRGKNQKELIAITEAWMQSHATDEEVLNIFEDNRVPSAPVVGGGCTRPSVLQRARYYPFGQRSDSRQADDPRISA